MNQKMIVCWKCLEKGHLNGWPLFKVKNSWVFACKRHKGLDVPDDAYSVIERKETKK